MNSLNSNTEATGCRKIVQIAVAGIGDDDSRLYALTFDGTLWELDCRLPENWRKLPPLPSETLEPSDCQSQIKYIQAFIKKHGISLETADHLRRCFEELERMEKLAACNQASPGTHQAQS